MPSESLAATLSGEDYTKPKSGPESKALTVSIALGFVASSVGVAIMLSRSEGDPQVVTLTLVLAALFLASLGFSWFTLARFPSCHHLPFMWAALILMEFVVSPLSDIYTDNFPLDDEAFLSTMTSSSTVCLLFVLGIWLGLAVWIYRQRGRLEPLIDPPRVELPVGDSAIRFLVSLAAISFAVELFIIVKSGALTGDLAEARSQGLRGTTLLIPLVRLTDIGALLASWISVTASSPRQRRKYLLTAILCVASSLVMPVILGQRFGMLQAILYFALPRVAAGKLLGGKTRGRILLFLPLLLALAFFINSATSWLRMLRAAEGVDMTDIIERTENKASLGLLPTHFRHMWLMADLLDKGLDLEPGNLYSETPFVGDVLVILPRALFPGKPITSMEVANGVDLGRRYEEGDRRDVDSVQTASLWLQLYLLARELGVLPLAALFSLGSVAAWSWSSRRAHDPRFLVVTIGLWFQLGWLSFNVCFTTLELPGMILGMIVASLLPLLPTAQHSPATTPSS